jgi:predicted TIM-barrel fold metal-dependent hydrolase
MPIIDSHTHVLPKEIRDNIPKYLQKDSTFNHLFQNSQSLRTIEELIVSMNEFKIDTSVILGMGWTDHEFNKYINDYLLESSHKYPKKIIPVTGIIPDKKDSSVYEAERCINLGAKGFGEIHAYAQNFDITNKEILLPYIQLLESNDLPIIIHSSEPVGHKYPGKGSTFPNQIEQVISNFPNLKVILSHWGGGIFLYELMPEIFKSFTNVYYDSATSPFLYDKKIFQIALNIMGSKKILFGSDFPIISQNRILSEISDTIQTHKDIENIIYENSKSLFISNNM